MRKKVFVSGCYDLLHSGHVEFFKEASEYGDLYVGIGSDATILELKHHKTVYSEQERLFMVKSIRYVKDAFINRGSGMLDFVPTIDVIRPDILVVNEDGSSEEKRTLCESRGIEYVVLKRVPHAGLKARSSTELKKVSSFIPTRLDLAGTWIDQPYVSGIFPGWAVTISLEPTFISGAQDAIGICVPGVSRHFYNGRFWPERIESTVDEAILCWLESHVCLVRMSPRDKNYSAIENKDITHEKVVALTEAASDCWNAIMAMDLDHFAKAVDSSFKAQISMFPAMVQPEVERYLEKYISFQGVKAAKLSGAGGGGYLALVTESERCFPDGSIPISIRRPD